MSENSVSLAYAQMKPVIDRQFPAGQFVAIGEGLIVADAPTHRELTEQLQSLGLSPKGMLIVQAGVEYPQSAVIFI